MHKNKYHNFSSAIKKRASVFVEYPIIQMIVLIVLIILCFWAYFNHRSHYAADIWHNKSGTIIRIGQDEGLSDDKFRQPVHYHTLLVQDSEEPNLFVEWPTTREKYYNYKIGQKVFFEYIRNTRYFSIGSPLCLPRE